VTATTKSIYSRDWNIWHLSHEGGVLEDPWKEPEASMFQLTVSPEQAPDEPEYVEIEFECGIPRKVNGKAMGAIELLTLLNQLGAKHGVGRVDLVENRLVGIKSHGVYETPGGTILVDAHQALEQICLDRETLHYKQIIALRYAELVYNGQWFTPLRQALDEFVKKTQETMTDTVRLKLYKGSVILVGRKSPHSLYREDYATFGQEDVYNQKDAEGFIRLFGLPMKVRALIDTERHGKMLCCAGLFQVQTRLVKDANIPNKDSQNKVSSGVTFPRGFRATGVACGIKKTGALDLALIASESDCSCAGVFTTNRVKAAPVVYDQELLKNNNNAVRAVVINSGCANACTGQVGMEDVCATAEAMAKTIGCRADQVLVLSTGVIGQRLDIEKLRIGIAEAAKQLTQEGGAIAARAIMTTDTKPKLSAVGNSHYSIGGIAKGAGMIHPNMATLLSVITTDAKIAPSLLEKALRAAVAKSFNRLSIDGDMSTNDTLLVLANGASGYEIRDSEVERFAETLTQVATNLAKQIARDGEGATKFVEIVVSGARDDADASRVARAIANSPLVKTAIYGSDANWGRVICAAGYSGVAVESEKMTLWFGDVNVFKHGVPTNFVRKIRLQPFQEKKSSFVSTLEWVPRARRCGPATCPMIM
jgi:glutamate N-acetyltransferase/amino-acid acetyltransferase